MMVWFCRLVGDVGDDGDVEDDGDNDDDDGGQAGPPWGDGLVLQVRAGDVDGGANDNVANDCMMKIMGKLQSVFSTVPPEIQCQNEKLV